MTNIAIRVENISKQYRIGLQQHDTLRDAIVGVFRRSYPRRNHYSNGANTIWALKDVSFEVNEGEAIGIIGRNGAGKSTLLKILSQITEPTTGRAVINGRVGSLLEVGTGFHPELTGRENIYLNAAILGMKRTEINRNFDEIVAFSEIEKFLDTPVKRYSSGMYVRLAFAVAAHLEPEILIVDEVLAVGDATFQKKCLGKMQDVAQGGRTVLFVSHNMVAIQSLCRHGIWLDQGKISDLGPARQVVANYLNTSFTNSTEQVWEDPATSPGNEKIRLHRICVRPENRPESTQIARDEPVQIEIEYWNLIPKARLHIMLHFFDEQQVVAFTSGSSEFDPEWRGHPFPVGLFRSVCHIPGNFLNSGLYSVKVLVIQDGAKHVYDHEEALMFNVLDLTQRSIGWMGRERGAVRPKLIWTTEHTSPL